MINDMSISEATSIREKILEENIRVHKLENNLSIHRSKIRQKLLAVIKSFL